MLTFVCLSSQRGDAQPIDTDAAWESVVHYLAWTKFWYGEFLGEACYNTLVGQTLPVTFTAALNAFSQTPESSKTHACDWHRQQDVVVNFGNVFISGTNLLFKLDGVSEVTSRPYKYRAFIVLGGFSDEQCHHNQEFYDMLRPQTDQPESELTIAFSEYRVMPMIDPIRGRDVESMREHQIIVAAVQRSIISYLQHRYFRPPLPGEVRNEVSAAQRAALREKRTLLIGNFTPNDPRILVYYEGDQVIYEVDFPKTDILADRAYCMEVSSANPYLPYDLPIDQEKKEALRRYLRQQIQANSMTVELPENWWMP